MHCVIYMQVKHTLFSWIKDKEFISVSVATYIIIVLKICTLIKESFNCKEGWFMQLMQILI